MEVISKGKMLNTILAILFLIFLVMLIWGLISPKNLSKGQKKKLTRKEVFWTFGSVTFVLFVLVGITAQSTPEPQKNETLEQQKIEITEPQESSTGELKQNDRDYWHKVERVVDGDTVRASVDGKSESIRVIGINSPESTTRTECFGSAASKKAKEFLEGKWIQLEKDTSQSDRDKYGRLLRYVWFDSGTDFGRRMIEEGYAYEYTYDIPYSKQAEYRETQKYAEKRSHGLWSAGTCDGKRTKPAPKLTAPKPQPVAPAPAPRPKPAPAPRSNCDPNYTPCVPNVSYDLDCADIGFSVRVIGSDPHRFDGDDDGYGCESY